MRERQWQVGICGTFDVANFGDLLFPLIAESELTARLGAVTLHRFSYGHRAPPDWPYEVTSVADLPAEIRRLDGLLVGGGFLIRFDKWVVSGDAPSAPHDVHHPTGYWLTPALLALQHDVPLVWNAPGMNDNEIPGWATPLMELVLAHSRYVSVRDEPSAASLQRLSRRPIRVVPDTAFAISRLLSLDGPPSAEFTRLSNAAGLDRPYIVVQAAWGMERFVRFVKRNAQHLRGFRFLALPVGPVLGDDASYLDADLPGLARLPEWPGPLVLAELIARSEAVVGHSYHLFVTALAFGVPVFASQWSTTGRLMALQHFETIFPMPADDEPDLDWFLSRVGSGPLSIAARATSAPLDDHWDRIAAALQMDAPSTSAALNRFWQSLPALLEAAQLRDEEARSTIVSLEAWQAQAQVRLQETAAQLIAACGEAAETQARVEDASRLLASARADAAACRRRVEEIMASTSWRLTAPVRFVGHRLRKETERARDQP